MAYEAFIKIAGVTTDTADGYIQIFSWSFGASNPTTVGSSGGGASAGKVSFSDFQIEKMVDSASTDIFRLALTGNPISTVTLQVRKAGGGSSGSGSVYFTVVFSNVLIAMYKLVETGSGNTPQEGLPKETIDFNFGSIEFEYHPQN